MLSVLLRLAAFATCARAASECFGLQPEYDTECTAKTTKDVCSNQLACRWGDRTLPTCYAKDSKDTWMQQQCSRIAAGNDCSDQIGCAWRSADDATKWVNSVSSAVQGLQVDAVPMPSTVSFLSTPTMSASHDHQSFNVPALTSTLNAWKVKYGLADTAITALSALVAVESTDFKSVHTVLHNGEGDVTLVAAGGRNYGGRISIAFAQGRSSTSLVKKAFATSCDGAKCGGRMGHQASPGRCKVDGQTTASSCCTGISSRCAQYCYYHQDCNALHSGRALTAAETSGVLATLQHGLFSKVSSDAVLLENELRAGIALKTRGVVV